MVNIGTPQSGVSHNQFNNYNVGNNGLILNNSSTGGTSQIGGSVIGNANLLGSGAASVIVNEVTGSNSTTLTGTTEIFGGRASVIVANPNGIGCDGCSFVNTTRTTLSTGQAIIDGGNIDLRATRGTVNVGPGGFETSGRGTLAGRHVLINGPVTAPGSVHVYGGSHNFRAEGERQGRVVSAPILEAKKYPYAIDASSLGALNSGSIRVYGLEDGLGVNLKGKVTATRDYNLRSTKPAKGITATPYGNIDGLYGGGAAFLYSKGDLLFRDIDTPGGVRLTARGNVRQFGDFEAGGSILVQGKEITVGSGKKLISNGTIEFRATNQVVVAGEVDADEVNIYVRLGSLHNSGFIMADGAVNIVAGEGVVIERQVATEYDTNYDPAIQQYLQHYQRELLAGGERADIAAEMIARAQDREIVDQHIVAGATISGTDVTINVEEDFTNRGGAVVATNDISISSTDGTITNEAVEVLHGLNSEDGCTTGDCGLQTNFHGGEILAGNDLTLNAGQDILNSASHLGAGNSIEVDAGRDVVNSLSSSAYSVTGRTITTRLEPRTSCSGKSCSTYYVRVNVNNDEVDASETLAPGRIVSLEGDVSIKAGRDFVQLGSETSAGNDIKIEAREKVLLEGYASSATDFVDVSGVVSGSETELVNAASLLIGRNIDIVAHDDVELVGASILSNADLNITSVTGSVLVTATNLPSEITDRSDAEVSVVELHGDLTSQIFDRPNDPNLDDVYHLYQTAVGREVTVAELDDALARLNEGTVTLAELAEELMEGSSFETQYNFDRVADPNFASLFRIYRALFNDELGIEDLDATLEGLRPEEPSEEDAAEATTDTGDDATVEEPDPIEVLIEGYLASSDFTNANGELSDNQFVTLLYQNLYGREPTEDELAAEVDSLGQDDTDRTDLVLSLSSSYEARDNLEDDFDDYRADVGLSHEEFLRLVYENSYEGEPNETAIELWTSRFNAGTHTREDYLLNASQWAVTLEEHASDVATFREEVDQSDDYVQRIRDDNLLTATAALRHAESGADIKDSLRAVGAQGWESLGGEITSPEDVAADLVSGAYDSVANQLTSLNSQQDSLLTSVTEQLELLDEALAGNVEGVRDDTEERLDDLETGHNENVSALEQQHQTQVADITASYAGRLYHMVRVAVNGGKSGTTYRNVRQIDPVVQAELDAELAVVDASHQASLDTLVANFESERVTLTSDP